MKNSQIVLFGIFVFLFFSCERNKNVSYEIPLEGNRLVMYGRIGNDVFPEVELYQTQAVLDKSENVFIEDVENIEMFILENDVIIDTFEYNPDDIIWKAKNTIPTENQYYSIQVRYQDENISSSPVILTENISIDSFQYQFEINDGLLNLKIYFSDPSMDENYYYADIQKMKNGEVVEKVFPKFQFMKTDEDIVDFPKSLFLEENINTNEVDEIMVRLYHLSPEFHLFYERILGNDNNLGNQFSNQLPPWTNIQDGYGFVGSYQMDSVKIQL